MLFFKNLMFRWKSSERGCFCKISFSFGFKIYSKKREKWHLTTFDLYGEINEPHGVVKHARKKCLAGSNRLLFFSNVNTRVMCKICLKLTIKTPGRCRRCFGVFIVNLFFTPFSIVSLIDVEVVNFC